MKIDRLWPRRSFVVRWAARILARRLMKIGGSYQCSGRLNWVADRLSQKQGSQLNLEKHAYIQVPASQIVHWILWEGGYNVSESDVQVHYASMIKKKNI